MLKKKIFSCFIVGDDNLTLQCAEILLAESHQVLGLISPSKPIKNWCKNHSIPYIKNIEEFRIHYKNQSFDYLFSIVNSQILPQALLKSPRYYSINYHNSPLPKYAGLYATSWAILNGETQHAISWHVMEEIVDAGPILKQPSFSIEEDETALSLNIKCFEHAVSSFRELVGQLAQNAIVPIPQQLASRSYYGLKQKPKNLGFISWEQSAEEIDRLYRALTLGQYTNQLATPKITINGNVYIVKSLKKLNTSSGSEPGKIVAISNECLQITSGSSDIALLQLMDPNGNYQSIETLANKFGLRTNMLLAPLNNDIIEKLGCSMIHCSKTERFWVNEFVNSVPETNFLNRLPKLSNIEHNKKNITTISKPLLKRIKSFSNAPNASKNVLLTAALIYFYRLNNYKNLSVAYRNEALKTSNAELYEFVSDYVPLTTHFDGNMSFSQVFQMVSAINNKLDQNKTFPKDLFIRYPELRQAAHTMELSIEFVDKDNPSKQHFDSSLAFHFFEDCSGFYVNHSAQDASYNISHAFLNKCNDHFVTLLGDALNNSDKKLFELSIIGTEEKENLLVTLNNTKSPYNEAKPLHQYFEEQVLKNPNAIAAVFEDKSISYIELNHKANILAYYLRKKGILPNQLIGICLSRSLEMLISILGILKSGGAYLPLDPNYPEERISYMLQDSQCQWLLMDKETIKNTPKGYSYSTIEINSILNTAHKVPGNLESINQPSDLAYVIYTSGTTGKPKGVAISHKAICNHMLWMMDCYEFKESDVFLQKTPYSFDASVWEFFMPLFVGGKLVIAPDHAYASSAQLIDLVQKNNVSVLQLVPTMLKDMITTDGYKTCTSLAHVFCGGEALTPETIRAFFQNSNSCTKLHNLYGPTEATIDAVTRTCTIEDTANDVSLIGQPINNTQVYVLDERLQPVPTGITGELYISGVGLAQGYINNSEATEKKFLENPFANGKQDRLYKTGDLVKWNADGVLEYHGRCDNQVKIRGYRIELSEVEFCIEKISSIHQCIVLPELNHAGLMSLSAYLVLNNEAPITAGDLRTHLSQSLPEYMIPSRFLIVEHFLTTPGGKIDRKNIPEPLKQLTLRQQSREPQSTLEQELKTIWCSSLQIEHVGMNDDFFALGGDSLSAMKIISCVKERLSINVTIRTLFECPTIHALANQIESFQAETTAEASNVHPIHFPIIPIKEGGSKMPLFLVHPIGGSIFWYKSIGQYMDNDRPLFGIQDPGLETNDFLFNSIEEMASYYVNAIQTIQPNGPYLLGGASFGTTVAVEMAKQLQEQGETVTSILSFDGWVYYPSLQNDEIYFKKIMKAQNARLLKNNKEICIPNAQYLLKLQWHREQLLTQYKLPMIQTKFVLFKAKQLSEIFQYTADLNWWDNYTTNSIDLHLVPGDHESMFSEPNIQVLSDKINKVLDTNYYDLSTLNNEITVYPEVFS